MTEKEYVERLKFIRKDNIVKDVGLTNLRTYYLTSKLLNNVGTRLVKNNHLQIKNQSSMETKKRGSISDLSGLMNQESEQIETQSD